MVYETPEFRALADERIELITKGYAGEATDVDRERLRVINEEMHRMEAPTIQADIARIERNNEPPAVKRLRELAHSGMALEEIRNFEVQDADEVLWYIDRLRGTT